jgi:drug/metabolite transporter (DMT)-like permease
MFRVAPLEALGSEAVMTDQKTINLAAWGGMALLSLIWGASFLANRLALEQAGVATTVAVRVSGAAVVLWAVVLWRGVPVPRGLRIWATFLLMGLVNNVIPFSLIVWGQTSIESGLAAILNASTAVMGVVVASLAFRDERLTTGKALGVLLGLVGVVVVMGPGALRTFDLTSLGQLAILGASLSYAVAGALGRVVIRGIAPEVAAAGMLLGSSAVMLPAALLLNGWPPAPWSPQTWGALLYLAVMASAVAYLIFYRLLRTVGAGNTSLVTLMIAPIAILLGAVVYGEALPLRVYAGFVVLALGLAVLDGRLLRRRRILERAA